MNRSLSLDVTSLAMIGSSLENERVINSLSLVGSTLIDPRMALMAFSDSGASG